MKRLKAALPHRTSASEREVAAAPERFGLDVEARAFRRRSRR